MGADVWDALIHHWAGSDFQKSSSQRKIARSHSKMSHTGGSKPFEAHKKDLEKVLKRPPAHIDLFKRTHKKKSKQGIVAQGEWVSDSAKDVFSEYQEPVPSSNLSSASDSALSRQQRTKAELDAYLAATGGVRENRIVSIPRVSAYILVQSRNTQAHTHAQTHEASTSGPGPRVNGDTWGGEDIAYAAFAKYVSVRGQWRDAGDNTWVNEP